MRKVIAGLVALAVLAGAGWFFFVRDDDDDVEISAPETVEEPEENVSVSFEEQLPAGSADAASEPVVADGIIVKYRPSVSPADRSDLLSDIGSSRVDYLAERPRYELVARADSTSLTDTVEALEAQPDVEFAVPNYMRFAHSTPNDPNFGELWGLQNGGQSIEGQPGVAGADIKAVEAWATTTGTKDVVVAVVDSGVAYNHPDLSENMWLNPGEMGAGKESNGIDDDGNGFVDDWGGWDFIDNDNDPYDFNGHGTHVAGTIGAKGNDGRGVTGVNWDVSIMPLRALDTRGSGSDLQITAAFEYAGKNGAHVVNASLGGFGESPIYRDVIGRYPNTLFVFASGNQGNNNDLNAVSPCNVDLPNVICVGATDNRDQIADFSNYGPRNVDLAAPGVGVFSTMPRFDILNFEDFESSPTWGHDNAGLWTVLPLANGNRVAASNVGPYPPNIDSGLQMVAPVETGTEGCTFQYLGLADVRAGDTISLQISRDGTNWETLNRWSNISQQDISDSHVLDRLGSGRMWLRFHLRTTSGLLGDGVLLDNLETRCISREVTGEEFEHLPGTSMASPHVAGVAALLLAAKPDADVQELRNALLTGVDPLPSLSGRVGSGGRLNAAKALDALLGR